LPPRQLGCRPAKSVDFAAEPLVLVAEINGHAVLASVNRAAEIAGLQPGLPLADARALCSDLHAAPADPTGDHKALVALAIWCGRYTPWTAMDPDSQGAGAGGLWLDISGAAHLFSGEDMLLADLSQCLGRLGYAHRLAAADTPGAAWAVTRFQQPLRQSIVSIPSGVSETKAALAPLSVAALRLAPDVVEGLFHLGLRRIEELLTRPRAPLVARFSAALSRRLDQALGKCFEAIEPIRLVPAYQSRLAFADPITHRAGVEASLDRLLNTLCAQLAAARLGVRRVKLIGYRVDGSVTEAIIGTGRPVREASHLRRLFEEKLKLFDPGFGIELLLLAAVATDPLAFEQSSLASNNEVQALAYLLDRLGNRFGPSRVLRLVPASRHLPEYAGRTVPAFGDVPELPAQFDETPIAPRPLQLLLSPELIEAVAPVPDRPPVMFKWRSRRHRVALADGPERISPEWWHKDPAELFNGQAHLRDYYRIEDTEGRRFWVFRVGLYRSERPPMWFLHGFFP